MIDVEMTVSLRWSVLLARHTVDSVVPTPLIHVVFVGYLKLNQIFWFEAHLTQCVTAQQCDMTG
jgi:hypothetical protein